jgi:hypothetical protein
LTDIIKWPFTATPPPPLPLTGADLTVFEFGFCFKIQGSRATHVFLETISMEKLKSEDQEIGELR